MDIKSINYSQGVTEFAHCKKSKEIKVQVCYFSLFIWLVYSQLWIYWQSSSLNKPIFIDIFTFFNFTQSTPKVLRPKIIEGLKKRWGSKARTSASVRLSNRSIPWCTFPQFTWICIPWCSFPQFNGFVGWSTKNKPNQRWNQELCI